MKHVLLISYTFPPYPGIGGRRWAKFAKYLSREGYTVHVICAENPFKNNSFYTQDVQHEHIKIYTFNSFFPNILQNISPTTLSEKVQYKIWMKILLFFGKGFVYDKAIFDKRKILSLAETIIKRNNITTVIATGGPFRVNYYALTLKRQFAGIRIITDFRDPWTWGNLYSKINYDRKKFEQHMLSKVIEESDIITVPVDPMLNFLRENYTEHSNKIQLLSHAFDKDEIVTKQKYSNNSFRCAFFGTMYSGIEEYFSVLCKIIANNAGKITLDIYPDIIRYREIVDNNNAGRWIQYKSPLAGKQLFETLSTYDYVIFIYPYFVKDFLSTKFYEVVKSKIPIIYIGEFGDASNFISGNNLGIYFNLHSLNNEFQDFIEGRILLNYNTEYQVDNLSFFEVTKKLIQHIK